MAGAQTAGQAVQARATSSCGRSGASSCGQKCSGASSGQQWSAVASVTGPIGPQREVAEPPDGNVPNDFSNGSKRLAGASSSREVIQRLDERAPTVVAEGSGMANAERQRSDTETAACSAGPIHPGRAVVPIFRVTAAPAPNRQDCLDNSTNGVPTVQGHELRRAGTHVVCNLCGATRQYAQRNAVSRCLYQQQVHIGNTYVRCAHVKGHVVIYDGNWHKCLLCHTVSSKAASIGRLRTCISGARAQVETASSSAG